MATYTPNYGLHQWEGSDDFLRTDFNEDLQKIDTALGEKAEQSVVSSLQNAVSQKAEQSVVTSLQNTVSQKASFTTGRYTGNGAETQMIYLSFTPKAVLVTREDGATTYPNNNTQVYGGLATVSYPVTYGGFAAVEIVTSGFRVRYKSDAIYTNLNGQIYHYIALK